MFILYTTDLLTWFRNVRMMTRRMIYLHYPQTRRLWSRALDISQSSEAERRQDRASQ